MTTLNMAGMANSSSILTSLLKIAFYLSPMLAIFVNNRLVIDFSILTWAFGKVSVVVVTWIIMQCQVILAYPLFIAWVSTRAASKVLDFVWLGIFLLYLGILFAFPINEILNNELPPVSRVIIVMEQVCLGKPTVASKCVLLLVLREGTSRSSTLRQRK